MNQFDHIEEIEVGKRYDTITEIDKFNPFHDAQGKFSSSNGFASYSANPKTKAGAMAIARSNNAGHGRTLNVHRESKGESITQNAKWLATGQKPKVPAAVSRARYQQQKLKQQQAQQASGGAKQNRATKPAQQQTKPNTKGGNLAQDVAGVKVSNQDKMAITQRNAKGQPSNTAKVANDNYQSRIAGKDISKTFDASKISGNDRAIDKIARANGWDKSSTVTNDLETFQKAATKSGRVMFRSVKGNGNLSADQMCNKTMTDGKASLGGNGGQAYGGGMYLTDCKLSKSWNAHRLAQSSSESYYYGDKQMMATVHPDAKIATPRQANSMKKTFRNMSASEQARFGYDHGAYIASKGYDGAKWHADSDPGAYTTMYNKSALIFYGGAVDANSI